MQLTPHQIEILNIIVKGNSDGTSTDLDEIILRASYKPTKAAIQFTIRSLVKHELIEKVGSEKRRGRMRVIIAPTVMGKHFASALSGSPSFVAPDVEEDVLEELEIVGYVGESTL